MNRPDCINHLNGLHKKICITGKCMFNASRRLSFHYKWSLWTVSIYSLYLILIYLLIAFGIKPVYSNVLISIFQSISAVVILVYSISATMQEYPLTSYKLHECGQELLGLDLKMRPFLEDGCDSGQYEDFRDEYNNILQRYSARHNKLDYYISRFELPEYYKPRWANAVIIVLFCSFNFFHYFVLLGIGALFIYLSFPLATLFYK